MEHKKKLIVLDQEGSRETDLPTSVELHVGEQVEFAGRRYDVQPSSHAMSDDGEVMTTTHILKSSDNIARS